MKVLAAQALIGLKAPRVEHRVFLIGGVLLVAGQPIAGNCFHIGSVLLIGGGAGLVTGETAVG